VLADITTNLIADLLAVLIVAVVGVRWAGRWFEYVAVARVCATLQSDFTGVPEGGAPRLKVRVLNASDRPFLDVRVWEPSQSTMDPPLYWLSELSAGASTPDDWHVALPNEWPTTDVEAWRPSKPECALVQMGSLSGAIYNARVTAWSGAARFRRPLPFYRHPLRRLRLLTWTMRDRRNR